MSARQWDVAIRVLDFGPWLPDDDRKAAELIRVVNAERQQKDPRPKVTLWSGERLLEASIDGESFTVEPGEHLICAVLPRRVVWYGSRSVELDDLRPTEES